MWTIWPYLFATMCVVISTQCPRLLSTMTESYPCYYVNHTLICVLTYTFFKQTMGSIYFCNAITMPVMQLPCHMYFKWLKMPYVFQINVHITSWSICTTNSYKASSKGKKMLHSLFFQSWFISIHCTLIRLVTLQDSLQSGTGQCKTRS
jgi:hypothetical protein